MLSLRLVIFTALAGGALWALFSLLDTLREPELLRSPRAIAVKGCNPIESEQAGRLCPQLFCQKSLLDARELPLRSRFVVTVNRSSATERLVGGVAHIDSAGSERRFACVLQNGKVIAARVIERAQLGALSNQQGNWTLN